MDHIRRMAFLFKTLGDEAGNCFFVFHNKDAHKSAFYAIDGFFRRRAQSLSKDAEYFATSIWSRTSPESKLSPINLHFIDPSLTDCQKRCVSTKEVHMTRKLTIVRLTLSDLIALNISLV